MENLIFVMVLIIVITGIAIIDKYTNKPVKKWKVFIKDTKAERNKKYQYDSISGTFIDISTPENSLLIDTGLITTDVKMTYCGDKLPWHPDAFEYMTAYFDATYKTDVDDIDQEWLKQTEMANKVRKDPISLRLDIDGINSRRYYKLEHLKCKVMIEYVEVTDG